MTRTSGTDRTGPIPGFEAFATAAARTETGVGEARQRAGHRFAVTGFPTRRDEAWRFTDVGTIAATEWQPPPAVRDATLPAEWRFSPARRLVFVDGQLAPELSDPTLTDGVVVANLRGAAHACPDRLAGLPGLGGG